MPIPNLFEELLESEPEDLKQINQEVEAAKLKAEWEAQVRRDATKVKIDKWEEKWKAKEAWERQKPRQLGRRRQ